MHANTSSTVALPPPLQVSADGWRVLLITNRDSDNLGDQVIEACAISLIETAFKNLGVTKNLLIDSQPLGIVTNKYCETDNEQRLAEVYKNIEACDLALFGGAPVFNYAYQWFFKKTATILRIAKELDKPVLFSAIGIDAYGEQNNRCQLLKSALHNGSVVQVTTRDGIEHLHNYAQSSTGKIAFPIALVSDPAVFTKTVFQPHIQIDGTQGNDSQSQSNQLPKIGLFVIRAAAFSDNKLSFPRELIGPMWRDLCRELEALNYDYELLTSGHFADEAFLGELIDTEMVPADKCVINLNTPEELLKRIASYSGVISCRLHPGIISFAYDVPSVNLVWNSKVTDFYRHIGYPQRAISVADLLHQNDDNNANNKVATAQSEGQSTSSPRNTQQVDVKMLVDSLERAIDQGIDKDATYIESVYAYLLDGLAACLGIEFGAYQAFTGKQLLEALSTYPGTTAELERVRVANKFTRCYRKYISTQTRLRNLRKEKLDWEIRYHSGGVPDQVQPASFDSSAGQVCNLESGNVEYIFPVPASRQAKFSSCGFTRSGKTFIGWKARLSIRENWFWCLRDGGLIPRTSGSIEQAALFEPGEQIPVLPLSRIDVMVVEAIWQSDSFMLHYNSGRTSGKCQVGYRDTDGSIRQLQSGSVELSAFRKFDFSSSPQLLPNKFAYPELSFAGWRMRVKRQGRWYWYCQGGKYVLREDYDPKSDGSLRIFRDDEHLPSFAGQDVTVVVMEATWKPQNSLATKLRRLLNK